MKIGIKILIPILLFIFILISICTYALIYINHTKVEMEQRVKNIQEINDLSNRINLQRQMVRHNTLMYRITPDQTYLDRIASNSAEITRLLNQLRPINTTPRGKALLDLFDQNRAALITPRDELIQAIHINDPTLIDNKFKIWEIYADNSFASLTDFISYNQNSLDLLFSSYGDIMSNIFITGLITAIVLIVSVMALYAYLNQLITLPLEKITQTTQAISQGIFTTRLKIKSHDELGTLGNNINLMSVSLAKYHHVMRQRMHEKEQELKQVKEFETQKDTFISMASHELKTPITSLKLFAQLLHKEVRHHRHTQYEKYLEKIENQINKMTNLITTLLDVSIIRSGKLPLHKKRFDINPLLTEVVALVRKMEPTHPVILKGKIKQKVYGDEEKIRQVIDNLVSNAIKYSPAGGVIKLVAANKQNQAIISVTDAGIGIDKIHQKKIFHRFYRVTEDDHKFYPGMGIGLYICADIIKKHQGKLWVDSVKGRGSTFTFSLPLSPK